MIILASGSPRRRELLQQIDCEFRVVVTETEEAAGQELDPEELVLYNAQLKALAAVRQADGLPVLGADTVVSLDGHIYGKPKDADDARQMLHLFSGRMHRVSTGIVFVHAQQIWQAAETTEVFFASLTDAEIRRYIATGEPLDKAGAYAVQGRAAAFIEKIHGSFSNVVGLPLHRMIVLARKAGIDLYGDHGEGSARG